MNIMYTILTKYSIQINIQLVSKFPILGCPLLDGRQQAPV